MIELLLSAARRGANEAALTLSLSSGTSTRSRAFTAPDVALVALGRHLQRQDYRFVTSTPLTHARVLSRGCMPGDPVRALLGWSSFVPRTALPATVLEAIEDACCAEHRGELVRSIVRFSSIGEQLFVHSAYPTTDTSSVFFGPDTYRFARAVRQAAERFRARDRCRILDVGCGSGAGGIVAADALGRNVQTDLVLADINERALRFAAINARINGVAGAAVVHSDVLGSVDGDFDLIVSNPPYLVDGATRAYRHGGGRWGYDLSLRIALESIDRLAPGGLLALYTGAAVVGGRDLFREALAAALSARRRAFSYEELDPDVFGEELAAPPYDTADRIAVVLVQVEGAKA